MKTYKHPNYNYITIVEIPKDEVSSIDMDLCAQPTQTLKAYYDACAVKPSIICNGGFYGLANGVTVFNYADDGEIISTNEIAKEGMGIVNGSLTYGTIGKLPFVDFVSGFPVLIVAGKAVDTSIAYELNYMARRTVLAYNKDTIFIVAIESPGMMFAQMQELLIDMKVDYAINLDGGGSTKILKDGKSLTTSWYNRPVDNVIAFWLKNKPIYRVQVGAFSLKSNAEKYLAQIKQLQSKIGVNYQSAYVRKIGLLYKVQVGAYSVKANAAAAQNELVSFGYPAFITTV